MNRSSAFSMIELLVVISIIAVLAALLLGGIRQVQAMAHGLRCASNMRQIGTLKLAYAAERQGVLPPAYVRSDMPWLGTNLTAILGEHGPGYASSYGWDTWWRMLISHHELDVVRGKGMDQLFVCGSSRYAARARDLLRRASTTWYAEWAGSCYGANTALLGTGPVSTVGAMASQGIRGANSSRAYDGWPGYGLGQPGLVDNRRNLSRIASASRTILLAEVDGTPHPNGTQYTNWADPPFVRTPVDADGVALTTPDGWSSAGSWPWNDGQWLGYALRAGHRGRSNYVFHDGHTESLTPWQTCSGDPLQPNLWTGR